MSVNYLSALACSCICISTTMSSLSSVSFHCNTIYMLLCIVHILRTKQNDKVVCGFSSVEGMALVNVEGTGMVGIRGVDKRIFGLLEYHDINVALISQAISEHSCTFATSEDQAELAKSVIEEEFRRELKLGHVSSVDIRAPVSIIAAVGDGM